MLEVLPTLGARFHAVITDPPYHLASIVKRFGADGAAAAKVGATGAYARASKGFMGKQWDGGDIAFRPETWAAVGSVMLPGAHLVAFAGTKGAHRMACAIEDAGFEIRDTLAWLYGSGFPKSHNVGGGWGTALKPAYEPIVLARWPMDRKTVAANVLAHGTGAINVNACRIAADDKTPAPVGQFGGSSIGPSGHNGARDGRSDHLGRFPANVVHDGSEEVIAAFPQTSSGTGAVKQATAAGHRANAYGAESRPAGTPMIAHGDSGSAARFFYSAKADKGDRLDSKHPTVKPVDLMRWLVRLVTPKGGLVLDPFAGSGTTGMACMAEGFDCHLIEREAEYAADIRRRIAHVSGADAPLFASAE